MNIKSGFSYVEIGGQKRPVKFGTNQTAIYCQLKECTLRDYQNTFTIERIMNLEIDGSEIRDLIYSALVAGCKTEKFAVDFSNEDVGDWIDEMPQDGLANIFNIQKESLAPNA